MELIDSALIKALVKAQIAMGGAKKDSENPHFKSKYADLESVTAAVRPVAAANGLAYIQRFHDCEGGVAIETIIFHEAGEQLSGGILRIPSVKQDAQGYGSAITYARRYSLMAAFGLAPEDDDGNAASETKTKTATPPPKPVVKPFAKESKYINVAQQSELKDLVVESGVDVDKILEFCEAKTFETIPVSKFQPAKNKLMLTIENRKVTA